MANAPTGLLTCKEVPCTYSDGTFTCGSATFPIDDHACTPPAQASTGSCSLSGALGKRAIITCNGSERVCCKSAACSDVLRAWEHRKNDVLSSCPVPALVGDSAIEHNEQQAGLDIVGSCPLPTGRRLDHFRDMRNDDSIMV